MNILYITSFYYPNEVGGAEIQTRNMAELMALNNTVFVICFDAEKRNLIEKKNGVNVIRLFVPSLSEMLIEQSKNRSPVSKFKLLKVIFSKKINNQLKINLNSVARSEIKVIPDIIHFSSNFIQFNIEILFNSIFELFPKSKRIVSIHDHFLLGRRTDYPHNKIPFWSTYKINIIKKYIRSFICPSKYISSIVKEDFGNSDIEILELPHYIPFSYSSEENSDSIINIMYAGNFEYQKGPDIVSKVFTKLYDSSFGNKVKLFLVGNGRYKKQCEEILDKIPSDKIVLKPKLCRKELFELMKKMEFVIVPSRYNETFGLIAAESIMAGAIPLVTNRGALPEVVNYNKNLIFNSEDELLQLLKKLISDLALLRNIKGDLIKKAKEYNVDEFSSKLNFFYRN